MLIIEKIFLLKSLDLFADIPEHELLPLASLLEDKSLSEGECLFQKGDEGDAMYIILDGSIRIHDANTTLATLKSGQHFGELSLLDTDTRSASASANERTELLMLRQGPFYELIERHFSIANGLIKTLCQRLREQNQVSVALQQELSRLKDTF
jgi:CRP/FNR family cyclic AMP-dependent transcriptional regulator